MRRTIGFVIGACLIIGLIDSRTEEIVFAAIYNPLDPSEEIVPTDPSEAAPEDSETIQPSEPEPKEEPEADSLPAPEDVTKETNEHKWPTILNQRPSHSRVKINDLFAENSIDVNVVLPENTPDGDDDDNLSYVSSLCYLLSGKVLYGQTNERELKIRVCDIFE